MGKQWHGNGSAMTLKKIEKTLWLNPIDVAAGLFVAAVVGSFLVVVFTSITW
jgi:hypothetical protein